MKRKLKYSIVAILVAGLAWAVVYLNSLMPIITGYAAKNLASAVFVSGRAQQDVETLDLNFSFISFTKNTVDFEKQTVTSRFLWGKSVAVYRPGFGCTLLQDKDYSELKAVAFPEMHLPVYDPDTVAWPMGNLIPDTATGADVARLNAVREKLIEKDGYGGHAFAFVVLHRGFPVAEGYNQGIDSHTKLLSWSMAKSFTSALAGVMVKDDLIDIDLPCRWPTWQNDDRRNITINDLLRMQSGLGWNEDYGNRSDVTVMLHCEADFAEYAANKPLANPPGEKWYYSSGTTNIVSALMRRALSNDNAYYKYPHERLFSRIGIQNAVFEPDEAGTLTGSSYLYVTARDYARFALLYLNDGVFNGERILPEGWVDYTTSATAGSNGVYGSGFWLNGDKALPAAPADMYLCKGHDGQRIFIIPEKELAVVVLSYSPKGNPMDFNALLEDVLAAVP